MTVSRIHAHVLALAAGLPFFGAAPALAQSFEPPPFEALELQKEMVGQRTLDSLEEARRNETFRSLPDPAEASRSVLLQMEIDREIDRQRLENALERDADRREETIREWTLPNRRIAASSVLVVNQPERYSLPPLPRGQYYARIDGRFVIVDAASEMVVKALNPPPADGASGAPAAAID